jgi:hypothetical protein
MQSSPSRCILLCKQQTAHIMSLTIRMWTRNANTCAATSTNHFATPSFIIRNFFKWPLHFIRSTLISMHKHRPMTVSSLCNDSKFMSDSITIHSCEQVQYAISGRFESLLYICTWQVPHERHGAMLAWSVVGDPTAIDRRSTARSVLELRMSINRYTQTARNSMLDVERLHGTIGRPSRIYSSSDKWLNSFRYMNAFSTQHIATTWRWRAIHTSHDACRYTVTSIVARSPNVISQLLSV